MRYRDVGVTAIPGVYNRIVIRPSDETTKEVQFGFPMGNDDHLTQAISPSSLSTMSAMSTEDM